MIIKGISYIAMIAWPFITNGQVDTTKTGTLIYNGVYKNICAYNVARSGYAINGADKNGVLTSLTVPFFDALMPDADQKMRLEIVKLPTPFPVKNVVLYSVYVDRLHYIADKSGVVTAFSGERNAIYKQHYLIGLDTVYHQLIYVSGEFYKSKLAYQFSLDPKSPGSYLGYLAFRLFNLQPGVIAYTGRRRNNFIYEFISGKDNRRYVVRLPITHPDGLIVSEKTR